MPNIPLSLVDSHFLFRGDSLTYLHIIISVRIKLT